MESSHITASPVFSLSFVFPIFVQAVRTASGNPESHTPVALLIELSNFVLYFVFESQGSTGLSFFRSTQLVSSCQFVCIGGNKKWHSCESVQYKATQVNTQPYCVLLPVPLMDTYFRSSSISHLPAYFATPPVKQVMCGCFWPFCGAGGRKEAYVSSVRGTRPNTRTHTLHIQELGES